jgi:ABC-type branched-subunit amino acid transport system ATPase component
MDAPRLELDGVSINFGGVRALDNFSLRVEAGEIRGLIGPNGSGKSTAFNVITGLYRPGGGEIRVDGRSVAGLRTDEIASRGVARTFQTLRLFRAMSVVENVMLGTQLGALPPSPAAMLVSLPAFRRFEAEARERSLAALTALHIADYAHEVAGNLPYGVQKRIDLARSLVANPSLLLLDEPAAGLTEAESHQLMELIRALHAERKFGLLLVEHDMQFVTNLCPRITVIDFGKLLAEGTPQEVRENRDVVVAYLGTGELSAKAKAAAVATAEPPPGAGRQRRQTIGIPPSPSALRTSPRRHHRDHRRQRRRQDDAAVDRERHRRRPSGQVLYGGNDVTRLSCESGWRRASSCVRRGGAVPGHDRQENLLLGAYNVSDPAIIAAGLERVYALFPRIAGRRKQAAGTLSGGEQQMVAIGRALMAAPKLLLLDEPSLGLAPNLVELIFETIAEIRKLGCAIMLVEQNASMALEVADFGYVLETGAVTLAGPAADLKARRDVIAAY